jgi:hypothetical protein
VDATRASAVAMLERANELLDRTLSTGPDGSVKNAGKITVDRATLVEIQTDLSQVKTMLSE